MKKLLLFAILFLSIGFAAFFYIRSSQKTSPSPLPRQSQTPIPTNYDPSTPLGANQSQPISTSLFFPYWTLPDNTTSITLPQIKDVSLDSLYNYIYFGVASDVDGHIQKSDPGYTGLKRFLSHPQIAAGKKLLTLRMVNDTVSFAILDDPQKQEAFLYEALALAQENGFDGVVLDLEVKGLPTEKLVDQITSFVQRASIITHAKKSSLGLTLYGDVFYRARPYDVSKLAPLVDQLYIMAYDFHKAAGQPGPNFPAEGANKYGYDLIVLTDQLTKQVPAEKITVVFGLFGYDWVVDEKRRPFKPASSKTLAQIKKEYIDTCQLKNCSMRRDMTSAETEITFFHEYPNFHDVWFEDELSVQYKIGLVRAKRITTIAFWGYGYY